jgi:hypothetical protein
LRWHGFVKKKKDEHQAAIGNQDKVFNVDFIGEEVRNENENFRGK